HSCRWLQNDRSGEGRAFQLSRLPSLALALLAVSAAPRRQSPDSDGLPIAAKGAPVTKRLEHVAPSAARGAGLLACAGRPEARWPLLVRKRGLLLPLVLLAASPAPLTPPPAWPGGRNGFLGPAQPGVAGAEDRFRGFVHGHSGGSGNDLKPKGGGRKLGSAGTLGRAVAIEYSGLIINPKRPQGPC